MQLFLYHLELCAPLFSLVFIGWGLAKIHFIPEAAQKALGSVTFKLLMPALLFKMLSHLSEMPPADWRVLIPFFGSCLLLFFLARGLYGKLFRCGAAGTTVLAMAGIFGNNVQLGVPIVEVSLGQAAMPTISLLIVFNVLLLWTLAIASVEFGREDGKPDMQRILKSLFKVVKNPVVLGILCGTAWGLTGWQLPKVVDQTVGLVAASTTPMCLLAVGMGLARHSFFASLPKGSVVTFVKIGVQPFFVCVLCRAMGLGELETNATVLLSALPVAINVFLMANEFEAEEGAASNAIFLSTLLSAAGVPLVLTLLGVAPTV